MAFQYLGYSARLQRKPCTHLCIQAKWVLLLKVDPPQLRICSQCQRTSLLLMFIFPSFIYLSLNSSELSEIWMTPSINSEPVICGPGLYARQMVCCVQKKHKLKIKSVDCWEQLLLLKPQHLQRPVFLGVQKGFLSCQVSWQLPVSQRRLSISC